MFRGIRLPAGTVKREGIIFLSCFLVALVLLRQIPAVLLVALVMYGASVILRVLYAGMARFWNRKNNGTEKWNNG